MKLPTRALVAGEKGSFEIDAFFKTLKNNSDQNPIWDDSTGNPLTIRISTPQESGIAFIDRDRPDRPYHHLLVTFTSPEPASSGPLKQEIEYTVKRGDKGRKALFLA